MTDQEIKTIQEKIGPEFEVKRMNGSVVVDAVDVWEGVEFVKCTEYYHRQFTEGKIYVVEEITKSNILVSCDDKRNPNGWAKDLFIPSTEQAYKDQLIKEAKERYGEIKDGDRFDTTDLGYEGTHMKVEFIPQIGYPKGMNYEKYSDKLYYSNVLIYKEGKWAKKIENPEVKAEGGNIDSGHFYFVMNDQAKKKCRDIGCWDVNVFLAQSLQDYLSENK